jgi:maleylacetoacetate isomerase
MLKLYGSARSSAAFRVRIALHFKELPFEYVPVALSASEHLTPGFEELNPARLVPVLIDGERRITQSLAIIEYLEIEHGGAALFPSNPVDRAYVQAISQAVACEIHPLNNLRVMSCLIRDFGFSEADRKRWYAHWISDGLSKVEAAIKAENRSGDFVLQAEPTIADAVLVPQIFNAQRFNCSLDAFPTVMRIFEKCMKVPAFQKAAPEVQPDF